ncbi:MAG TPA: WD40 repeat domain-containing protein [Urbifossiella sp.]|nr:WD40 repeat domain-containing protein [Urbifossiella sp.]
MRTLHRRKQRTTCLTFSPTGHELAVGGRVGPEDGRVDVWELTGGDKPVTLPSLSGPPWGLAFTPGGGLAVALPDQVVLCSGHRFRAAEVICEWGSGEYTTPSLAPDGCRVAVDTRSLLRLIDLRPPFAEVWSHPVSAERVTPGRAAFSPDGRHLAVKGGHTVEVREAATGLRVGSFGPPSPTDRWFGSRLLWSPDGRWVCEVWQQWVNVWDAASGACVFQRVARSEWINDAAFHPTSGRLAIAIAGRSDGAVRFHSPGLWQEAAAFAWPVGRVGSVAFSTDGTLAAAGGDRPEVVVWDMD